MKPKGRNVFCLGAKHMWFPSGLTSELHSAFTTCTEKQVNYEAPWQASFLPSMKWRDTHPLLLQHIHQRVWWGTCIHSDRWWNALYVITFFLLIRKHKDHYALLCKIQQWVLARLPMEMASRKALSRAELDAAANRCELALPVTLELRSISLAGVHRASCRTRSGILCQLSFLWEMPFPLFQ